MDGKKGLLKKASAPWMPSQTTFHYKEAYCGNM